MNTTITNLFNNTHLRGSKPVQQTTRDLSEIVANASSCLSTIPESKAHAYIAAQIPNTGEGIKLLRGCEEELSNGMLHCLKTANEEGEFNPTVFNAEPARCIHTNDKYADALEIKKLAIEKGYKNITTLLDCMQNWVQWKADPGYRSGTPKTIGYVPFYLTETDLLGDELCNTQLIPGSNTSRYLLSNPICQLENDSIDNTWIWIGYTCHCIKCTNMPLILRDSKYNHI